MTPAHSPSFSPSRGHTQASNATHRFSAPSKKQAISDKEKVAAENQAANLEKQNEWIAEEKDPAPPYDFKKADINQLRSKAQELENQQKGRRRKSHPKSAHMLEDAERQTRMLETIDNLDHHKREAVETTWTKVNGDFGAIFAELLPGNFAKLQPPEGQDLMQGLEVKVRLGTVWKQSLTELSGGQRSLIALSLIMSLLQFKPAPMYILDEIDAALDLSHTQHIGQLFRTRFKGSQFIVVSLKEGLFTNANVLFRTRFRDGTSIVERTANRSASALYQSAAGRMRTTRTCRRGGGPGGSVQAVGARLASLSFAVR
ncbi:P-loop containing nucleoside triphosphate hydrolase protein [Cerioporus squamosus]|nr:P-loop containing nucleoside triphosphate hydrolase protein [Cerioporus squamosus]